MKRDSDYFFKLTTKMLSEGCEYAESHHQLGYVIKFRNVKVYIQDENHKINHGFLFIEEMKRITLSVDHICDINECDMKNNLRDNVQKLLKFIKKERESKIDERTLREDRILEALIK